MYWQKLKTYTIPEAEKRVGIILLIVLLLPILAFTVFELSRLNSNEQMIQEIYSNQLDAVLFSVNQYSNDVLNQWANEFSINEEAENIPIFLQQFIDYNPAVKEIILFSFSENNEIKSEKYSLDNNELIIDKSLDSTWQNIVFQEQEVIKKQAEFIKNNYQKIEVFPIERDSLVPMTFALKSEFEGMGFVALMVNTQIFIEDILAPKLQEVTRDKFIMTSFVTKPDKRQTYFTDSLNLDEVTLSRPLWLLPDHYLGIAMKGNNIDKISKARTKQNLYIMLFIDVFLLLAIYLVYRNIRKEIVLARVKSEFVSNVSHEIRTPLAMISMFAETLLEGRVKNEDKKVTYYKMITDEALRLNGTVNKILNFSKIESGKQRFEFFPTDLQLMVDTCLQSYQSQFSINNFEVSFNKKPNLPLVSADKQSLSEAINNLIDNAIKYSKERREIIISTAKKGKFVLLTIQDFGIGIPTEYQKDIFNRFYRVPNHDIHDTKGTGLGLTLVKHIIDAHKGKIELNSALNKGTTFKLYLQPIETDI